MQGLVHFKVQDYLCAGIRPTSAAETVAKWPM